MTQKEPSNSNAAAGYRRLGHMALAVTVGVSVAGFLIGVKETSQSREQQIASSAESPEMDVDTSDILDQTSPVPTAVAYSQISQVRRGPNVEWSSSIPPYQEDPTTHYGATPATVEQRTAAITIRQQRRAYSGAPPVVPHPIDERNAQACLACHGEGIKVGTVVAPKMSHEMLPNCTQCHVEGEQDFLPRSEPALLAESSFVGLSQCGEGDRIGPGAPPTIPHPLGMRSECMSCHGSLAPAGLRTSHPWRTNCVQCHAPNQRLEWAPLEQPLPAMPEVDDELTDRLARVMEG